MTTTLSGGEIKMVFFCVVLVAIMSLFSVFYTQSAAPTQRYDGKTEVSASTSTVQDNYILGLLDWAPAPFDSPDLFYIRLVIIDPIKIFLAFISLRYIKDLITGWI